MEFTASRWGRAQIEWDAILANVTTFNITIEAVFGGEQNGVDNIVIQVPEPRTWALLVAGTAVVLGRVLQSRGSQRRL